MSLRDVVAGLRVYYESSGGGEEAVRRDIATVALELLAGVTVTSVNFEGAGGAGAVNRKPDELLALLNQVLAAMEGNARVDRAQAGFSGRCLST